MSLKCGCRTVGRVTTVCESCTRKGIEATYAKYPGLREFKPDPDLDLCCQRDQVADEFGWDAAYAWDTLQWSRP